MPPLDEQIVEDALVELVAEAREQPLDDLRAEVSAVDGDLELDSLEAVEVMLVIEERFGIRLPDTEETVNALQTVSTLVTYIVECSAGSS